MNHSNRQSTNSSTPSVSSPGVSGGEDGESENTTTSPPTKSDSNSFIGKDRLLEQFRGQLEQFEEWYRRRDWLAFHHHHYDWWMFPSELKNLHTGAA
jgi:hypothetical protein